MLGSHYGHFTESTNGIRPSSLFTRQLCRSWVPRIPIQRLVSLYAIMPAHRGNRPEGRKDRSGSVRGRVVALCHRGWPFLPSGVFTIALPLCGLPASPVSIFHRPWFPCGLPQGRDYPRWGCRRCGRGILHPSGALRGWPALSRCIVPLSLLYAFSDGFKVLCQARDGVSDVLDFGETLL